MFLHSSQVAFNAPRVFMFIPFIEAFRQKPRKVFQENYEAKMMYFMSGEPN